MYVFAALALAEVSGYVILAHVLDYQLGSTSERHLYSPTRGHVLNPEYRRSSDTDGARIHSVQGFRRDGVIDQVPDDETIRIFMMGGSTLYGIGSGHPYLRTPALQNSETISHFLEMALNEEFVGGRSRLNIEVVNAGVVAYQSFQHVTYILESLYEYEPDIILFLDGHNDFYNVGVVNLWNEYGYSSWSMVEALNGRYPFFSLSVGIRPLGTHSYVFRLLEKVLFELYQRTEGRRHTFWRVDLEALGNNPETGLRAAAEPGFMLNYTIIKTLGEYHDFDLHVFLQPEIVFEEPHLLSNEDYTTREITINHYPERLTETMLAFRPLFGQLFEEIGVPFTDIGSIAAPGSAGETLYTDYCHLTAQGSRVVAERMLPVVRAMIEERLRKHGAQEISGRAISTHEASAQ